MLRDRLVGRRLAVVVKPSAHRTEVLSEEPVVRIAVAAPPEDNRANVELLKFLRKELGPCRLVSGATSKRKVVEFLS